MFDKKIIGNVFVSVLLAVAVIFFGWYVFSLGKRVASIEVFLNNAIQQAQQQAQQQPQPEPPKENK